MGEYYLAIDIGASSGRHILGFLQNGKVILEEIYRFENKLISSHGHLCWDFDNLFQSILEGLKKCKEIGKIPTSMGIDTWGVDFVLLDDEDEVIGQTIGYRDSRTNGMDAKVEELINPEDLYKRTGIQKQLYNSIYQLYAIKEEHPEYFMKAKAFLLTPEFFNFKLTGNKMNEYTIATTTQLISPTTKQWDYDLIDLLGFNKSIFNDVYTPGEKVGNFTNEVKENVGFDCNVILAPAHDTASAVLAVPTTDDDSIYISSGTWSLMGIEKDKADLSIKSMKHNFTNEGGYNYRFRYLKNIMGLWMIQSVRNELKVNNPYQGNVPINYTFAELCKEAEKADYYKGRVDVNDHRFLAPTSMIKAVEDYLVESNQLVPKSAGELAACIYHSLAESYADTVKELEEITKTTYNKIYIVGGGSNADYLNQLTAQYTNKKVYAGPGEATAIGNILAQMLQKGVFVNVSEARKVVYNSFDVKEIL